MKIRLRRPNPDGLDPVYEAYQVLRDVFYTAEIEEEYMYDEDGEVCHVQEWIKLPTGDVYPADDANPLLYLEWWLEEQHKKNLGGGTE